MSRANTPAIFIVTGIMATGKSTVAELLTRQFSRGVHLRGDVFRCVIDTGREEMLPQATAEAERTSRCPPGKPAIRGRNAPRDGHLFRTDK
ncbi:MAG: hypothetical protein ACOX2K_08190 [Bacillota bacterium]|jgi:hypothetical protein